tara:strand:- start:10110 stop:10415 length:306 start_codon:yes stop_codon:yes gene_type:complete
MKKIIIFIVAILLNSCGGLDEAGKVLRNEKIQSNDEFLVKKKTPLVMPPNFEEIPEPGSINRKTEKEEEKIKSILSAPQTELTNEKNSSSVEESILRKIKK